MTRVTLGDRLVGKQLVFFDCDGVLLDSNGVKLAAVDYALAHYSQKLRDRCKESFRLNFGRPRLWHFEVFQQLIAPVGPDAEHFLATCISRYEDYLRTHYSAAPLVAGAQQLLAQLAEGNVVCAVVSGGKEEEIIQALRVSGIDRYMVRVIGSPTSKTAAIRALLDQYGCDASQALFLGDAIADAEAAITCKVPFIFVSGHALVGRSALSANWPADYRAGEVPDLQPDNPVSQFSARCSRVKEDFLQ
ncbi:MULTISPECIES: HAD family hydrolase [Pseudomonas]|jgi:phosphoglycolate phosphatase-like HAD superfamily hydrolase|uniref:phosphoglycolate phosphatase n=1 Tax=Pseudomonas orientalis TaxID=76758 RepID=A0A4Q7D0A9_9PSED|nr:MULTISPECIES: HAD hydrolase-like protein [Pseudomonas]POM11623.1 HAD family hydrolase [Pseudomonas sp. WP001]MBY8928452.1 HAD family hydrolase [Pseudomonas sp. Wu6]RZI32116.1 HAD family hydrolase [Pseudomonas orientalis]CRM06941.1 phosphoglycolate phosphatase [Pseudomonas sp. 24 E 13]CRM68534.1 phosphoglycolate phosphatase [Pseudomonas sp. 44 R 15]